MFVDLARSVMARALIRGFFGFGWLALAKALLGLLVGSVADVYGVAQVRVLLRFAKSCAKFKVGPGSIPSRSGAVVRS
jgi:hypothetical protein